MLVPTSHTGIVLSSDRTRKKEKAVFKLAGLVSRFNSTFLAEPVFMFIKAQNISVGSGKR